MFYYILVAIFTYLSFLLAEALFLVFAPVSKHQENGASASREIPLTCERCIFTGTIFSPREILVIHSISFTFFSPKVTI